MIFGGAEVVAYIGFTLATTILTIREFMPNNSTTNGAVTIESNSLRQNDGVISSRTDWDDYIPMSPMRRRIRRSFRQRSAAPAIKPNLALTRQGSVISFKAKTKNDTSGNAGNSNLANKPSKSSSGETKESSNAQSLNSGSVTVTQQPIKFESSENLQFKVAVKSSSFDDDLHLLTILQQANPNETKKKSGSNKSGGNYVEKTQSTDHHHRDHDNRSHAHESSNYDTNNHESHNDSSAVSHIGDHFGHHDENLYNHNTDYYSFSLDQTDNSPDFFSSDF